MKQEDLRRKLIDGTIHVIATDGLDKATTKQIAAATDTNEVYIYRYFKDKEDMFVKVFDALDEALLNKIMRHVDVLYMQEMDCETRFRFLFSSIWQFMIDNRDQCLAFIRYYYSPYFKKYSAQKHRCQYEPLIEKFKVLFREEADTWMILNHILNIILDFAIKVHNGEMPEGDNYVEHVFRVVYASIRQYFRDYEE